MKYPHIVVRNGVWYPAGTEVPAVVSLKTETVADVPAETERTIEALADMPKSEECDTVESSENEDTKPRRGRKPKGE